MSEIAAAVGGDLEIDLGDDRITDLSIDTRRAMMPESTLFIALRGPRHDGHHHIDAAAEKGVRSVMVERGVEYDNSDLNTIEVPDTLDALQRLCGWHRAHFQTPVVGITGSNGKTVVKEWLHQVLREHEHIVRSPGSWNSQVGVPLSVWEMRAEHTLGLFEAGISQRGEMERLRSVIRPTVGVFTNIGPAHGENFTDDAEKALEKMHLFTNVDVLVYCADHAVVHEAVQRSGVGQRAMLRGWSRERSGWMHVLREEVVENRTRITVMNDAAEFTFEIPFTDHASAENALHCVTLLLHLGHPPAWIAERMQHLAPVAMRLEVLDGMHGTTLINDAYSNDAASLAVALEHLGAVAHGRSTAVVLSDIIGSKEAPEALYTHIAALLKRAGVGTVIGIGPQLTAHQTFFPDGSHFFPNADAALEGLDLGQFNGATMLVKGARTFALERLVQRWQRQVHDTVLEIDLDAVRHNLNIFRGAIRPSTKVMAMIKAFGYGSGSTDLARMFSREGVDYLGVAYVDEGIQIREAGVDTPTMVMNPTSVSLDVLARFGLEHVVYNATSLGEACRFAALRVDAPLVHLKLDTGMHRLGFEESDIAFLIRVLKENPRVRVASIFSHLAASETKEWDTFTNQQVMAFMRMAQGISASIGYRPLWHILNSAGVLRFPEAQLDMVRIGIGLHGMGANKEMTARLRPSGSLYAPITQIRQIVPGETIGYGRSYEVKQPMKIAVLPIGYADGISRKLGITGGTVWIHSEPAPFVGSICMDMCTVDVTRITCQEGDLAYFFNSEHPISEMAKDMGTIPYEALTSISSRIKRKYVHT